MRSLVLPFVAVALISSCNCDGTNQPDAGPADAGPSDASVRDAGSTDAGAMDAGTDAGSPTDAGSDDAGTDDAGTDAGTDDAGTDAGTEDAGMVAPGCADGTREGLLDPLAYPFIAACAGVWEGNVANATPLCEQGWSVCRGTETSLKQLTYTEASSFPGCFPFDAAQDNYTCHAGCADAIAAGVDTAANIDMGAVGAGCRFQFATGKSCLAGGRIDASENSGSGCDYLSSYTGVLCCTD